MTAQKAGESGPPKTAPKDQGERKPWVKKSPVQVVLDQIEKVRADVAKKEAELKEARRQLQKLEDARKLLEAT